jgi:perosamine synthetase
MKTYPLAKPKITKEDRKVVNKVLKSAHLSRGPQVKEFESCFKDVIQTQYASSVSSGTAGLIIALQALEVTQNDEVITVSYTVPATVNSILAIGAKAVMVDIETETFGMCPQALQQAITKKTKAIIVVHAFGKAAKLIEIIAIAKEHGIPVIEDACEAIGNKLNDKPLGSFADIGVFAFYPNKQITSGEGGMLVTNNEEWYQKFELLKNHGRTMNGDLYDQISFGWNFRLSDINAALGLSQIKRLAQIIEKRKTLAKYYQLYLDNTDEIALPQFSSQENNSAWFVYVVLIKNPDLIKDKMEQSGIQCGRYFSPVHLQPFYKNQFPNLKLNQTELNAEKTLALPLYTQLRKKDIAFISNTLLNCMN